MRNHLKIKRFALFAAGLLLTASGASASYKVGEGELSVRGAAYGIYDDNVTYSKTREIDDFITELSAGADLIYFSKLRNLRFAGTVIQQLFADNSDFNNTGGDAGVYFDTELSKYDRLSLSNRFSYDEEARSFDDEFERNTGRYGTYRNRTEADYEHDWTDQVLTRLAYSHAYTDNTRLGSLESSSHDAEFDVEYATSSKLSWIAGYQFRERVFYGGDETYTNSLVGGFRYKINQLWTLEARESADFINTYDGDNITRPATKATLIYANDERGDFRLSLRQRYETTSFQSSIFEQWRVSLDWRRELSSRLRTKVGGFYGESEYSGTTRENELIGTTVEFTYELTPKWKAIVNYSYTNSESSVDTAGYEKNRIMAGLSYDFA